jgi:alpha-ribazole phosphatase
MTISSRVHGQSCGAVENSVLCLVLLRHAQTDFHGRFCGHSNPALSVEGRGEIPGIIQRLSSILPSTIWCSDLQRAEQTAAPIAKQFGVTCRSSASLREMNFGLWEGLTWKEVETQFPEDAKAWSKCFPYHQPPEGESFHDFQRRVISELERLGRETESVCTLVVTHAGFIRTAIAWVLGIPESRILRIAQDHGATTVLQKAGNHWIVAALNAGKPGFTNSIVAGEDRT